MSDYNKRERNYAVRESFKDIFGVWLLKKQSFEGNFDMPVVGCFDDISSIDYLALFSINTIMFLMVFTGSITLSFTKMRGD